MTARTQLWSAALGCAAGAGVVLVAAGRDWAAVTSGQGRPWPGQEGAAHSGAELVPWLPALAWLALAGAGAVLATAGLVRRLLGAVLAVAGVVLAAGSAASVLDPDRAAGWPVVAAAGAVAVTAAGAVTLLRGGGWPAMGLRYERPAGCAWAQDPAPEAMWVALDRGDDPTVR